jgi:hypothetical protein
MKIVYINMGLEMLPWRIRVIRRCSGNSGIRTLVAKVTCAADDFEGNWNASSSLSKHFQAHVNIFIVLGHSTYPPIFCTLELLIRKVAYTKYDATGVVRWSNYS